MSSFDSFVLFRMPLLKAQESVLLHTDDIACQAPTSFGVSQLRNAVRCSTDWRNPEWISNTTQQNVKENREREQQGS